MTFDNISIEKKIEEKIIWAETRFMERNDSLLEDPEVREMLSRFREAAESSHKAMVDIGIFEECRHCEEEEGGACCGRGLEDRYSGILLLINLLLGRELPKERYNSKSCFFLTDRGCSLLARHVICVNYICKKITKKIDAEKINFLREKEGRELETLFRLNEKIRAILEKG
jgi:hypothetical protein